jgi:antitoxin (DNA-binding transcriptional repressor) of toxin-antitoxin stability system
MRSITISQLRNTRLWLPWIKAGETIDLYFRKELIGRIVPHERFLKNAAAKASSSRRKGRGSE